jgi:hypothetical protein
MRMMRKAGGVVTGSGMKENPAWGWDVALHSRGHPPQSINRKTAIKTKDAVDHQQSRIPYGAYSYWVRPIPKNMPALVLDRAMLLGSRCIVPRQATIRRAASHPAEVAYSDCSASCL